MYLGLDLGTSSLKGLLIKENGSIIGLSEFTYKVSRLQKGWSEQNPDDWIFACKKVFNFFKSNYPSEFSALKGIGISGQMHGATLLDFNGKVLYPCILWNDTRSHTQADQLDKVKKFREISGNIVFPGFTAPKLMWLAQNEQKIFSKISKVLLPKDFLNFWLTGEYTSDMSDGSGTSWLDTEKRQWSEDLLNYSGMVLDQMPTLYEGIDPVGSIRSSLAKEWGISKNVVVVGGAGDNAAIACGIGIINESDTFLSLGTSGVILTAKSSFSPRPDTAVHTFCHAIPNRWYQMGVILSSTDCLNWLSKNLGKDLKTLIKSLGHKIKRPNSVYFLPYLSGERTPHNDSLVRAAFLNLDISTTEIDLTQSVLEGVGFALRDSLEALKASGSNITSAIAVGGGSKSLYWLNLIANILNVSLKIPKHGEYGASLGAAKLAIIGVTGAKPEEKIIFPTISKTIFPSKDLLTPYNDAYYRYRNIYPALKALQ